VIYLLRYWKPLAVLALLWGVWLWGDHHGQAVVQAKFNTHLLADAKQDAEDAKDLLAVVQKVRAQEQALVQAAQAAADAYEKGKRDAEAAGKRVADELRAGTLKLRDRWAGCQADRVSDAAEAQRITDDAARDREESAGRIVRAAADADAQIRALQDFIRAERASQ